MEAELVAADGVVTAIEAAITGWDVIGTQAGRVEPVFESGDGSVVLEGTAIPDALERRDLVIAGAFVSGERVAWVGIDAGVENVEALAVRWGNLKGFYWRELIVGVERRRMALSASLGGEDLFVRGRRAHRSDWD